MVLILDIKIASSRNSRMKLALQAIGLHAGNGDVKEQKVCSFDTST